MRSRHYPTVLAVLVLVAAPLTPGTPLDDYVAAPDSSYRYSVLNTVSGPGYTAYIIEMTSQSWRSADEVDRTLWKHWLTIVNPINAGGDKALDAVLVGGIEGRGIAIRRPVGDDHPGAA